MHVNGPGALMIPKILLYTPSLQRFHLCDCPAGVDVLASLVQLFGAQLLHLDITLSEEDVPLSLALIGKFVALQRLQLNLHELEDTLTISDGPTTAFHMPKLRSLELNPCNHEEFARFIARGYFPALIELTFKFVHRPVGHQPTTCEAVRLLFEKFGSGLKRISVSAPELEDIAEILFPFMTNVEEITMRLELFPTLLDIARFIPKSVVRLCLETYWNMTAYDHALVSCLDDLHYNAKQLPLSLVVRMLSSGTHPFLWRTVTGTNPSLAGKLLRYSLWLQEEGIQLQDESGMWVGITMGLTGS
ncbi:hypothetical protein CALCODRAFT_518933 [Calocera cornea HHB12733]|uniref:F-box domain-containing protein n=1 Tax=Calocera cornea HHB12733 TaxID=1353952 RepID=A0A165EMK8_9BASI|nr:hypothetical protein CALCODRAFT_518933 [Calocera cornea HHB12733]